MATSREYADFVLDKFRKLDGVVTVRPMMGEYVIHMAGRVLGFLADEQLLLEPGPTIAGLLPDAERRELFPGSKLMYVVDDGIAASRLCFIAEAIYDDLPISKPRKSDRRKAAAAAGSDGTTGSAASEEDLRFPFAKHVR